MHAPLIAGILQQIVKVLGGVGKFFICAIDDERFKALLLEPADVERFEGSSPDFMPHVVSVNDTYSPPISYSKSI
jgi:hypothetical protein